MFHIAVHAQILNVLTSFELFPDARTSGKALQHLRKTFKATGERIFKYLVLVVYISFDALNFIEIKCKIILQIHLCVISNSV